MRELDVQVARALGQSKPPEDKGTYWELSEDGDGTWYGEEQLRCEDGSWARHIRMHEWPLHYSANIAAAWMLVEWMQDHHLSVALEALSDRAIYTCTVEDYTTGWPSEEKASTSGQTMPEAICRAFLAAKEANDDHRTHP